GRSEAWQRGVPQDPPFDVLHEIERRTRDAGIVAIVQGARHGYGAVRERVEDAELAIDGVRRRQQRAGRLAAQHVAAAGGGEKVGRVGLPAAKLPDLQSAGIRQPLGEPVPESRGVHGMRFAHRHGGRGVDVRARGHGRYQTTEAPPSTAMIWPVMWRAAPLASSTTRPSRSAGSPSWRSGVSALTRGPILSSRPCDIFEGMKPGQMALTVMPNWPHSPASARVKFTRPPLLV